MPTTDLTTRVHVAIARGCQVFTTLAARGLLGLATAAAAGLVGATWAPTSAGAAPPRSVLGVTPTRVLIGSDQPLSGPAATGYDEIAPASRAFFEYVNARGGVHGRAIDYTFLDDADEPAKALADESELVFNDDVFAVFNAFGNVTHAAVVDSLNAEGVPDLFVGSSCACWNEPLRHPFTFGFGTNYAVEGRLIGNYVADSFRAAKVAYISEDGAVGCCQEAVQELDEEIPSVQVVTRQSFTVAELLSASRLLPQVLAAQKAGAKVLVLATLAPAATALVLLDAAGVDYHPTILDTFRLSADPNTVGSFIARFSGGKASAALENGLVTEDYLPSSSDTANPWIRLFRQIHDAYEPQAPFDNMAIYGMAAGYTFTDALWHAGRNPTRESILDAVNAGRIDFGGPGLLPLQYAAFDHDGYPGEQIGRVENGDLVLSGPVFETHLAGPVIPREPARTVPPRALTEGAPRVTVR